MDPQQQALVAALMGGQNNVQPSMISPQPQAQQFSPQMLGYGNQMNPMGGQNPQMMQGQMQQQSDPTVAQIQNAGGFGNYYSQQQQVPGMYAQQNMIGQ